MARTWYPVIDYIECIECGSCVKKCPHGVYDVAKEPSPVVLNPDECIDHCHGCGNLCPQGAITYVGDNTGWRPPLHQQETDKSDTKVFHEKSDTKASCCESSCSCQEECQ